MVSDLDEEDNEIQYSKCLSLTECDNSTYCSYTIRKKQKKNGIEHLLKGIKLLVSFQSTFLFLEAFWVTVTLIMNPKALELGSICCQGTVWVMRKCNPSYLKIEMLLWFLANHKRMKALLLWDNGTMHLLVNVRYK